MSQFKAFVVTRGKQIFMLENTDLHEDIIEYYNLDDTKLGELSNIVRLMISPTNYFFSTSKRNWKIIIGEGIIPEWFKNREEKFIDDCFINLFILIRKWRKTKKKITCLKEYMAECDKLNIR